MIQLTKTYQITGAQGASYSFSSSANITFSNSSGTIDSTGLITTVINYPKASDFAFPITLTVTKDGDCISSQSFTYANPCSSFSVNITKDSGLIFNSQVTGGTSPYNYKWTYDTNLFNNTVTSNPSLSLTLKDSNFAYTPIQLKVTDKNGCVVTTVYSYYSDAITIADITTSTLCLNKDFNTSNGVVADKIGNINLSAYPTASFLFTYNTSVFDIVDQGGGIHTVYVSKTYTGTSEVITVSGETQDNIEILPFTVNVAATACDSSKTSKLSTINFDLCGTATSIDLEDFLPAGLDYSTFTYLDNANQTVSGTTLTGERIEVVRAGSGLTFTDRSTTVLSESINYEISSTTTTYAGTILVNANCTGGPTVADGTICNTCEVSSSNISVAPLVTGSFDPASINVTVQPTDGQLIVNNNGTFTYIQSNVLSVNDQFDFTVTGLDSQVSNTARMYITRSCAGKANTTVDITCQTKTFNLNDIAEYTFYANGSPTWTETTAGSNTYDDQGGTITGGIDGTVDFTGIDSGTYTFELQLSQSCSAVGGSTLLTPGAFTSISYVTVNVEAVETLNTDSISHSNIGGGLFRVDLEYTITNFKSFNDFRVLANGSNPSIINNEYIRVGNDIQGTVSVNLAAASYAIGLRMTSSCATLLEDIYGNYTVS